MILPGIYASQISGHLAPAATGSYDALMTYTVPSGGVSSVTFAGIPTGYQHLQVRYIGQTARPTYPDDALGIQLNNDTAANYSYHTLRVSETSTTVVSEAGANQTSTNSGYGSLGGSGGGGLYWGVGVIDILDYANTNKYKTIRVLAGSDNNTAVNTVLGSVGLSSGSWRNTSAINSISLFSAATGANFTQYSTFTLYGVK